MGPICDLVGPRVATATLSFLTVPVVLATGLISSPSSFILIRFLLGFCLANFVASQFWMSSMFSSSVVGLANGVTAGWANMGAGVAQLIMPLLYSLVKSFNVPGKTAWRAIFVLPAVFQALTAVLVLVYGQDLPCGNYRDFKKASNKKSKENFFKVLFHGLMNYRGWILALTYGFCFGVEMTMDNIVAQYFYYRFGVNLEIAGTIASCFALTNWFARPMGGVVSDRMGKRFGIRGRLWGLWVVQTVAGLLCVLLGRIGSLGGSVVVMCIFSVFVQASSGLTFGVVPFVSKRSLGVISGMTGSGGTLGAVVTQMLLFSGDKFSTQTSISLMGLMMILCTLSVSLIYFPRSGGMFCDDELLKNTDIQTCRPPSATAPTAISASRPPPENSQIIPVKSFSFSKPKSDLSFSKILPDLSISNLPEPKNEAPRSLSFTVRSRPLRTISFPPFSQARSTSNFPKQNLRIPNQEENPKTFGGSIFKVLKQVLEL
ncbi:Major facilitator superfamily [Corchorus olitorius]|uniref:Major facilitator superfamily n=1 Tax=Corchorus olitorius TaxID=93759 RepID=A0A1R3HGC5_9ROSI|nr:Major facilitator superfamily [Corchorus olitorius]